MNTIKTWYLPVIHPIVARELCIIIRYYKDAMGTDERRLTQTTEAERITKLTG